MIELDFITELLENRSISLLEDLPSTGVHRIVGNTMETESFLQNQRSGKILSSVPNYLTILSSPANNKIKQNRVATHLCIRINLTKYHDWGDYLKSNWTGKQISNLRSSKRRLELCFPITYRQYYGSIEVTEYDMLFERLKRMIQDRFDQLGRKHADLEQLEHFKSIGLGLIHKKMAGLFVIYQGDEPISIAFNTFYKNTMYGYMRGFDPDYYKFYLGFTDLLVQIEWCFKNGIAYFDLLRGNFKYKDKFANETYLMETLFIYPFGSSLKFLLLKCSYFKLYFKYAIFYPFFEKIRGVVHRLGFYTTKQHKVKQPYKIEEINLEQLKIYVENGYERFDLKTHDATFPLKQICYTFLYSKKENIGNLKLFKCKKTPNQYIISGQLAQQKVIF